MSWGYFNNPIDDLPTEKLERAMTLLNGVVALCEGRNKMDAVVYATLRREFMRDPETSHLLPPFVRSATDTGAMWAFLKDYAPRWEQRRSFVREQFQPLIEHLEDGPIAVNPISVVVAPIPLRPDISTAAPGATGRLEERMYNLFVSHDDEAWNGTPWQVDASRCVNSSEYTDAEIARQYGDLDAKSIEVLCRLPSIFAYEAARGKAPNFGRVRNIIKRQGQVRIEYELQNVKPFLSHVDLEKFRFELDVGEWELNRTHWAVKNVNLAKELQPRGIALPHWARGAQKSVNITTHNFDVALSFPGEARSLVEAVAGHLEPLVGSNAYFYDNNYKAQLARPSLDVLLQDIYRRRSKLIVAFLSSDYQRKSWCGVEFRAIRDIIKEREHDRIMFVRTDDGSVDGVFDTDGYVDARFHDPAQIAHFIKERVDLLP